MSNEYQDNWTLANINDNSHKSIGSFIFVRFSIIEPLGSKICISKLRYSRTSNNLSFGEFDKWFLYRFLLVILFYCFPIFVRFTSFYLILYSGIMFLVISGFKRYPGKNRNQIEAKHEKWRMIEYSQYKIQRAVLGGHSAYNEL